MVGAVIGFIVTGYNPQGAYYGAMIGPAVGQIGDPTILEEGNEYFSVMD
ncbi:hypothetical protein [Thermomonas carbonis]|uniref:Uncharacterized protein n=1 Tax=Thermomonas carbonis TaxID=1463158 RepID=A0A7G9SPT0_9GAMM|nr:hypothetical protein [Thermomonas carbonis]QNN69855.1 hypothetical protein H9L16_14605 [Thermomonas carbonis]GHB95916.1 hypothetical protein GCM10010080_04560 [Thermomonas carbonis]